LIEANQATFPVVTMCSVLEVFRSGFYAWKACPPSQRAREDATLTERIRDIHAESRETYGP
jgi:putative transposase